MVKRVYAFTFYNMHYSSRSCSRGDFKFRGARCVVGDRAPEIHES